MGWEPLISTTETARYLGLAESTVYRLVNAGDLPAYRIGRLVKFRPEEVRAFVRSSGGPFS